MAAALNAIAGGPDPFLTAHHLVLRGANRPIVSQLASLAQNVHCAEVAPCRDPLCVRAQRRMFRQQWRSLFERLLGVAVAFERLPDNTSADLTPLFAFDPSTYSKFFGCSSAFAPATRTSNGHNLVLRNLAETAHRILAATGYAAVAIDTVCHV